MRFFQHIQSLGDYIFDTTICNGRYIVEHPRAIFLERLGLPEGTLIICNNPLKADLTQENIPPATSYNYCHTWINNARGLGLSAYRRE